MLDTQFEKYCAFSPTHMILEAEISILAVQAHDNLFFDKKICSICWEFFLAIARDTGIILHYLMIISAGYNFTMIILAQEGPSSEPRSSEYTKTICSGLHMKQRKKTI